MSSEPQQLPAEVPAMVYPEAKAEAQKGSYAPKPFAKHDVDFVVTYNGVCASDMHQIDNNWGMASYPLVPGHEVIGHVIKVGEAVTDFKVGDVVGLGAQCQACYDCEYCNTGRDSNCAKRAFTYVGPTQDETGSHRHYGGFGSFVRTDSRHVFHVPKEIEEKYAGPLMCAGNTVAPPLFTWANGEDASGKRVGIIGIGGLGHLAIQFASKMNADVVAFSRGTSKKDLALQMGAKGYVDTTNEDEVKAAAGTLDFLLITISGAFFDFDMYTALMKPFGTIHAVGTPDQPVKFNLFPVLFGSLTIKATPVGGIPHMKQMLAFAAKHNVRPIIEEFPHSKCNEAMQKVRDGTIRFRAVLKNDLI